ncbi:MULTISPECIES: manganese efflux pump MntP [Providencia]|uniref:Putative manganese efflux pump MntP n=1 Tax=Providencia alcalifaciens TaxID=126385 RepID=A0A4R3NMV6_9GAMM|nr:MULTISPECIES: manganese efflux pump MntP [Providencia]MBC5790589.1 manganese efflux pump MntP [Providencia sp. JUb39]MTC21437.1 manganese efflux pump MntP [Providencia sp. wls1938]TCT35877.1 putative Mn2+ efflux pump MntP [Providencia alcalifaciens]
MSFYATLILAFALSMDAFAVAICKGAVLHKPRFREILRTGFIFGFIEAITPIIGWGIGILASQYVIRWDHWIAFALLFILGGRMIWQSLTTKDEDCCAKPSSHSAGNLVLSAIATSLDAMAIGLGLAFLQVDIVHTAMTIGLTTMIMATIGMMIGRYVGPLLGKKAEILGGLVLIAIGFNILFEHLELFMYAS